MGYGSYSYDAHQAIAAKRQGVSVEEVFSQRSCHPLMEPKGVDKRESRDSPEHPDSLGIVFALDVSGSMGAIPRMLAQRELPGFMKVLTDCGVASPQILFMAFQDVLGRVSPLQVGQFETTAELMDQWLTWCWLMGGGASPYESYDLACYFAARHTAMDCFEKRQKKGYFFMTGDEPCFPALDHRAVKTFLGDDLDRDLPFEEVIAELRKTFHPFFLIPDPERGRDVAGYWHGVLGKDVITLASPSDTCVVAGGLLALSEGVVPSLGAFREQLASQGMAEERIKAIVNAMRPWAEAQ